MQIVLKNFAEVADAIPHGALLLWRRDGRLTSRMIAACSRSIYSHVGTAARLDGELYSLEMLQWQGGVKKLLADYVREYPGRIDVFDTDPRRFADYDTQRAVERMLALIRTQPYGWRAIFKAARWSLPILRLFGAPSTNDAENGHAPHCAAGRSIIDRYAGIDPVLNTPSWLTTPGDFSKSLLYGNNYLFTLV